MRFQCVGLGVGLSIMFLLAGITPDRPALGAPPPKQKKAAQAAKGAATKEAAKRGYVPRAGYLRTNKQLFLDRKNAESTTKAIPGAATPLMVRGVRSLPVILVEYQNVPA